MKHFVQFALSVAQILRCPLVVMRFAHAAWRAGKRVPKLARYAAELLQRMMMKCGCWPKPHHQPLQWMRVRLALTSLRFSTECDDASALPSVCYDLPIRIRPGLLHAAARRQEALQVPPRGATCPSLVISVSPISLFENWHVKSC